MILAVDIGNTNIVVGCIKGEEICFVERMSTEATRTELEYAISFKNVLEMYGISIEYFFGCAASDKYCETVCGEDSEYGSHVDWSWCEDGSEYSDG